MFDIEIVKQSDESYDLEIVDGDFRIDEGFRTSLIISLLSDRRADESQVTLSQFRRGWICDLVTTTPGFKIGSHLWLLENSRIIPETLSLAEDYAQKSLQWLLDENLAIKINASASISLIRDHAIDLVIEITSPSGSVSVEAFNLWKRTLDNGN